MLTGRLVCWILLAAFLAAPSSPPSPDLSIENIRARVIRQAPLHRQRAREYRYQETVTAYRLEGEDDWMPRSSRTYQVFPIESFLYRRLIRTGGVPLAEDQQRREAILEEEFRREVGNGPREDPSRWRKMFPLEKFVNNYEFHLVGEEWIDGRPAVVFDFRPGEWKEELLGSLDRIFQKLEGRVWVDREDDQLVRVEGRLNGKIRWGLGLVATVNRFEMEVRQRKVDDEVWLPVTVSYLAEGSTFLVGRFHKKKVSRFHDFDRIEGDIPPGSAPVLQAGAGAKKKGE